MTVAPAGLAAGAPGWAGIVIVFMGIVWIAGGIIGRHQENYAG